MPVADTTLRFVARKRERTSEITAVRLGESITLTSVQGGVRADYTYSAEPVGTTTRATLVADVTTTPLWRPAAPALRACPPHRRRTTRRAQAARGGSVTDHL